MQKIPEKLQGLFEYEAIKAALHRAIYHSLRPEKFEAAWEDMIQRHGIKDHGWIQTLYEDRKRWAPIYLKEAFLSGVFSLLQNEVSTSYFEGYLDKNTPLKEFLDKYDQALRANYQLQALADMDSRNSSLKEEFEVGSNEKDSRAFDVLYNASDLEMLCVCGCSGVDIKNPVHKYDDLYKRIVQVVEEGRQSQDRYKVTLQALDEILNKLHLESSRSCRFSFKLLYDVFDSPFVVI
ncbi:protein FAR1-RELATED SEQUENCE 6 [Citrus sinensis]|uniref:Protein FAR1-RELATED SEQUENCE 6 n=1 Tax=Citrus sinensis TaxID=2711 RepID=A0ACB8JC77_CITSI|nr:protein FAR1-RELATED SEQUENCE 6 [Citrus sinensis]